jgi:hypothetical protein
MNSKAIVTTFLIWVALIAVFAATGIVALDWQKWRGLARRGVETEGRVVAKELENHRFIRYSYEVGGQTYSGLGSAGRGNPEFEQLNIGDRVKVFYDSDNPKESFLGNPQAQADSITRGVLFLAILGPLFSIIGLYAKGWLPFSKKAAPNNSLNPTPR